MKKFWEHRVTHFVVVMLVFAITGTTVARLSAPIASGLGIEKFSALYWLLWIVVLFPLYQVLLLTVAFLFCKFSYFRDKQIKLYQRIGKLFSRKAAREKTQ